MLAFTLRADERQHGERQRSHDGASQKYQRRRREPVAHHAEPDSARRGAQSRPDPRPTSMGTSTAMKMRTP
ncbi:hypothetical protein K100096D8_19190 [Eggerthella lenta]